MLLILLDFAAVFSIVNCNLLTHYLANMEVCRVALRKVSSFLLV